MKVILLKDVPGTGKKGDVKEVSSGYARNYLLKHGLVKPATAGALFEIEAAAAKKKKQMTLELELAQKIAGKLDGSEIEIVTKAESGGRLYAGVNHKAIADAVKKQLGVAIDPRQILITEPIKEIGESAVIASFGHGLEAEIRVIITAA